MARRKKTSAIETAVMCCTTTIFVVWWVLFLNFGLNDIQHDTTNTPQSLLLRKAVSDLRQSVSGSDPAATDVEIVGLPRYPIDHRPSSSTSENTPSLSKEAIDMCHRTLWHTLETTTYVLPNNETYVITGDIKDLWLRDSAAQIHPLLLPNIYQGKSLVQFDLKLERVVSGLIKKTAFFIRFDPYANAFNTDNHRRFSRFESHELGRHGYIGTWNYELDSACYFMRMLYFFQKSFPDHPVLMERQTVEAVEIMIDLWIAEQRHEEDAYPTGPLFDCKHCGEPYRYNPKELLRNGKGTETNPNAGLTWSGFRPSDDPCQYGYLVPANMFAVVVLEYMEELATTIWHNNENIKVKARKLREDIERGIREHGIVKHKQHGLVYAYEVDGLGNSTFMDDANVPSLLSIPYLGYKYDPEIYENTQRLILSRTNKYYHSGTNQITGDIDGIGSPHTKWIANDIWPMAMAMKGLVSNDPREKIAIIEKLVLATAGTGWMHESFNAKNPKQFSRKLFCWPDSLFAELVMSVSNECPQPEAHHYGILEWQDAEHPVPGSVFSKDRETPDYRRKDGSHVVS